MKTNRRNPLLRSAVLTAIVITATQTLHAQSILWNGLLTAGPHTWNTSLNWTGSNIPNADTEIGSLAKDWSAAPTINFTDNTTINGVTFDDTGGGTDVAMILASSPATAVMTLAGTNPTIQVAGTASINSPVAGTTAWRKTGGGVLVLNGTNTFNAAVTVADGTLRLGTVAASAGAGGNITVTNGENPGSSNTNALELAGGLTFGAGRTVTLNNTSTSNIGNARTALINQSGNNTWAGSIVLLTGLNQTIQSSSGTFTITGNITNGVNAPSQFFIRGAGNGTLTGTMNVGTAAPYKTDAGTWTISSTGNVHGNIGIANGGITVNNNHAIHTPSLITFGEGNANRGTLTINGGFVQALGGLSIASASTATTDHRVIGAGTLDFGWPSRPVNVIDMPAANDMTISTPITGAGGFTKTGAGRLLVNGASVQGAATVSAGSLAAFGAFNGGISMAGGTTLIAANLGTVGTVTTSKLAFGTGATTLEIDSGEGVADLIQVTAPGGLTQAGLTTVNVGAAGGFDVGVYPLITYTGASPAPGSFVLGTKPDSITANIIDTGSAIALNVTVAEKLRWTGAADSIWDTATLNWDIIDGATGVAFGSKDDVVFADGPTNTSIALVGTIDPQRVEFTADTTAYTLASGTLSGSGRMDLVKSGDGNVILQNANTYTGLTDIQAGTLELDNDGGTLTATSGVVVGAAATFKITDDEGAITFNRSLSGSGTVKVNPHSANLGATSQDITISGASPGFSGNLILESPLSGSSRLSANAAAVGSATITVENENQLFCTNGNTYPNNITITGDGFNDALTSIGALRLEGATWNGSIAFSGTPGDSAGTAYDARIGSGANNSTINGSISGGDLSFWSYDNASCAFFLTAANSFGDLIIGGSTGSGATGGGQAFVAIGANQAIPTNTTATLGSGDVFLVSGTNATDPQNTILRINRADGYTLASGQDITGSAANALQWGGVQLHVETLGSGFSTGANTIDLADATIGGLIRVGFITNGSIFNIDNGATVSAGNLHIGEVANSSAVVNQAAGSAVSVINQLRVGHFATETSSYNLNGGSLSITGASPAANPSSADVANEQNGGIYVGVDGQGIFNQAGGDVSTNWVVLDNRGNTGTGANMTTGIDQYNLSGGSLELRSNWGIIQRNTSAEFNFSGGTISISNLGTGTGTGSDLTVPLNTLINVSGTGAVLDTVAADNEFSLNSNVLGTGTVTVNGGGELQFNPTAAQTISAVIAGASPVAKLGTSATTLTSASTYSGATAVKFGTLNVAGSLNNSDVSVLDAATIGGEGSVKTLTLGVASGSNLLIDGATPGALTVNGALTHNGTTKVDFSGTPTGNTVTVLNYNAGVTGTGIFELANPTNYRSPSFSDSGSVVTLTLDLKELTWTGTDGVSPTAWNINGTENWTAAATAQKFYNGDSVTFNNDPLTSQTVDITGNVLPEAVTFNHSTIDYTLNGTAGNGIGGTASLTKAGTGTLNLAAANTFSGPVSVTGGVLKLITGGNSGLGATGNTIAVASPGQVNYNGIAPAAGTAYSFSIAGDGPDSRGALINETASLNENARILNLTLTGNASVGAYGGTLPNGNRFDIGYNGAQFGTINGGGFTLTKVGDAMVNLRAPASNITYVVNAGTLRAENSPLAFGTNTVTVNGGGLDSWGNLSLANPVVFATGTKLTSSSGTATWTGGLDITGDVTFGGAATIDVASVITGVTGSLVKADAGTLILSAANTYGGTTTVTAGNLQANNAGAFNASTVNITNSAAAGRLIVNGGVTVPNNVIVGSGPGITGATGRGLLESTGTGQGIYSGTITINSAPSAGGTLVGGAALGNELVFTGPVNVNVVNGFTQRDGRVIFSGGGTAVAGCSLTNTGTTILGANEGMPSGLSLNAGGSAAATFEMNGFSQTLTGLTRAAGHAATVTNSAVGLSTLSLNVAGSLSYTGLITGNLALTKLGTGTQELTVANSYTGGTTVTAGTLRVSNLSGSATGTGTVTVDASGTVAGIGTIGGDVVVNGQVAPGVSTGTLTMDGNVGFNAGSTLLIELNDASAPKKDLLSVAGALSATSATLDFDVTGTLAEPVYVVATYTGTAPSGFTAMDVPVGYTVDYNYNGNSIALVNAYFGWAAAKGLTAGVNDGKQQDPDNDGVANVVEFATDGDPLHGAGNAKIRSIITDVDSGAPVVKALTITLPVRTGAVFSGPGDLVSAAVDGIVYTIQSSINLSDFTTPNVTEVTDNAAILTELSLPALSGPGWTYRTFRAPGTPGTDAREFLRIEVE